MIQNKIKKIEQCRAGRNVHSENGAPGASIRIQCPLCKAEFNVTPKKNGTVIYPRHRVGRGDGKILTDAELKALGLPARGSGYPSLEDTRPNWKGKCIVCGASPIMPATEMCGPCSFGEADTAGGNW